MLELAPGRNGDEESDPTLPMKAATLEERSADELDQGSIEMIVS